MFNGYYNVAASCFFEAYFSILKQTFSLWSRLSLFGAHFVQSRLSPFEETFSKMLTFSLLEFISVDVCC